jgi:membrane protein YqaA with SNARE-associated domain
MDTIFALSGLFGAAFVAATVIPFQSEVVFVALQALATAPVWVLVLTASIGNTLGAFVNYWLGAQADRPAIQARARITPARLSQARRWWGRWGVWSLLLSWAPVIGWVTVVAGAMRTPLWQFTLLVAVAKTGRYALLGWAATGFIPA